MKKLLIALAVFALAVSTAQASLIDLTPGGITYLPQPLLDQLNRQVLFDEAVHNWPFIGDNWVSAFGRKRGQQDTPRQELRYTTEVFARAMTPPNAVSARRLPA